MADAEITRRLVNHFWTAMQANDWAAAAALFADDYVLRWPPSGEHICSGANVVANNSVYATAYWRSNTITYDQESWWEYLLALEIVPPPSGSEYRPDFKRIQIERCLTWCWLCLASYSPQ